jgi:hypothetical protein
LGLDDHLLLDCDKPWLLSSAWTGLWV